MRRVLLMIKRPWSLSPSRRDRSPRQSWFTALLACVLLGAGCVGELGGGALGAASLDAGGRDDGGETDAGLDLLDSGAIEGDGGTDGDPGMDGGLVVVDVGPPGPPDARPGVDTSVPPDPPPGTPDTGTPPPPPPPPPSPPTYTALFSTRSAGNGRDTTLEDAVVALADGAVPGSRIRIALYKFTRASFSSALIRAHGRGVDVRVVLDGQNPSLPASELSVLRAGLGAARVTVCDAPGTACVGSGIMHHKTFLFSQLSDGSRDVVVQGSHNVTANQLSMHNNLLVIRGDAALFAAYERTWEDLRADIEIPNYYRIESGSLATRAYFYPRTSGDTVVSFLRNVACDGSSRIRVAMAFFTNARVAIAEELAARRREGCDVRVVIGDGGIAPGSNVLSTLRAAGVEVTRYPERSGGWGLHSKYMIIDAPYSGSAGHRRLVFTGSHNWTGPALTRNDETLLRVEDGGVFDAYFADWTRVRAAADVP